MESLKPRFQLDQAQKPIKSNGKSLTGLARMGRRGGGVGLTLGPISLHACRVELGGQQIFHASRTLLPDEEVDSRKLPVSLPKLYGNTFLRIVLLMGIFYRQILCKILRPVDLRSATLAVCTRALMIADQSGGPSLEKSCNLRSHCNVRHALSTSSNMRIKQSRG